MDGSMSSVEESDQEKQQWLFYDTSIIQNKTRGKKGENHGDKHPPQQITQYDLKGTTSVPVGYFETFHLVDFLMVKVLYRDKLSLLLSSIPNSC